MNILNWTLHQSYQEAVIGPPGDCVTFSLSFRPSCYRRGQWRLLVEVCGGKHHLDWGCFDEADQPERNYHHEANAKSEAEAIAKVLLADRITKGGFEMAGRIGLEGA